MPKDDIPSPSRQQSEEAKFPPGQVVATSGIIANLTHEDVATALSRHVRGDWGDLCEEDREANEQALRQGDRLVSVYHALSGTKLYVITEWDRSLTTVLLPEEY